MKSYISTPIVDKSSGDISYIHVPLEAAFGVGNVLYMTSSASNLDNTPNTPVSTATSVTEPQQSSEHPISVEPTQAKAQGPPPASRTIGNLSRLFQMVGLRR